ncbi:2-amino-4-hydroxy-6-hydroxymethyldihydropteridine diphosphokinase [Georgenia sp. SYP-B2076]|uniref:2-amino-4-hydroxy-6- hydroxymethyldihydropteridine diphosphokinase n=1 Tax=Georgenia sp. SYP-B2076 TaxID=2495881 RepID=UPI0013DEE813|nr:2-amino-4-hydroxy-6-hydroxymethyldihydropteridine diphosphokinase [Georgenia sp. SYP-B2076]
MTSPVLGADGQELDQIRLLGLGAVGHHGVFEHERVEGQPFGADVVMHLDTRAAARADDLAGTVSYADVADDVAALLGGEPVDLLETLAERIAQAVLARPGVRAVDVTVHKPRAPLTVPFDDVQVSIRRRAVLARRPDGGTRFVLALGANLGDPLGTLREVVGALGHAPGVRTLAVSPLARTAAVLAAGQAAQPDYLNAVVVGATTLAPLELLALGRRLEAEHGRRRDEHWGARTLDVDVISVGDLVVADPVLTLPHPRAHERAFVLVPWAQAEPGAVLPGPAGGLVAELADRAPDRRTVRWLAADWLSGDVPDLPAAGHGVDAGAGAR